MDTAHAPDRQREPGAAERQARPPRIYLTGMMGSGKSTVGPRLAERLGYDFADLDNAIMFGAGTSIARIFDQEGEAGFRRRERSALKRTARSGRIVIATGGGTLAQPRNLDWAREHGVIVYLRLQPQTLARRLRYSAAFRPLLCTPDGDPLRGVALERRLADLLQARRDAYEQADLVVDTDGLRPASVARHIAERLAADGFR
jgi:shikimate kinase